MMEEKSSYVLPSESEKLSHKYILDAIKRRRIEGELFESQEIEPPDDPPSSDTNAMSAAPKSIAPHSLALPDEKQYFRIGEVVDLIGVEAHVLRYWESEFPNIHPEKSGGQRVYRRKDVENLHLIRHLLHEEKFSIKGAKKKLLERKKQPLQTETSGASSRDRETLNTIAETLRELIRLAQGNPGI